MYVGTVRQIFVTYCQVDYRFGLINMIGLLDASWSTRFSKWKHSGNHIELTIVLITSMSDYLSIVIRDWYIFAILN